MNDEQTKTAAGEPLTTQADQWALEAAALEADTSCKDEYVQTTEPLFDKQTVHAVIQPPEKEDLDNHGWAVKIAYQIKDEMTTTDGIRKSPPFVWKPRFSSIIKPGGTDAKAQEQAQRGRKDIAILAENLKLLPRGASHKLPDLVRAVSRMAGTNVVARFYVEEDRRKRDANGNKILYQRVRIALPGDPALDAGNGAVEAVETAGTDGY